MKGYFLKRILAIIPTFFGITLIAFTVLNLAPGGPVEQMIRQIRFKSTAGRGSTGPTSLSATSRDTGVNQEVIEAMRKQYGFDKPVLLNFRIEDHSALVADAVAHLLYALDASPETPAARHLQRIGPAAVPILMQALLHPHGNSQGLWELVQRCDKRKLNRHAGQLLAITEHMYRENPRIAQDPRLISVSRLLTVAMEEETPALESLLKARRAAASLMGTLPPRDRVTWANPLTGPVLSILGEWIGETHVESGATLEEWWRNHSADFSPDTMHRCLQATMNGEDHPGIAIAGTALIPGIIELLDSGDAAAAGPDAVPILIGLLENLSGEFFGSVEPAMLPSTLSTIQSWWRDNDLLYTDVPAWKKPFMALTETRYGIWLRNIFTLDFGQSFTYEQPVIDVILSKMPVSMQFGIVSFFLTYLVCIPLGIFKAVKDGQAFDYSSSIILFLMWSIPGFMLAVLLIVFFGGGSFFKLIPIGGLYSDNYFDLTFWQKVWDRIHHFIAPLICYMIAEFTTLTLLMKNSIIEEISKDYCRTARAKGLSEQSVMMKHAFRNALIPIATGIGGFLGIFFAGSMLLELIFNLDGMGLLGYTAVLARDFNVIMGDLVIISIITLLGNIVSDFIYTVVDPRIDFV